MPPRSPGLCPGLELLTGHATGTHTYARSINGGRAGVCLKGRALWGPTQSSYKAVGAHCKIGWGGSHWRLEKRGGGVLGLWTCLRVELLEERWEGRAKGKALRQGLQGRRTAGRCSTGAAHAMKED